MLMDMKLCDFCALLASKEPAPGGGSVSALSGVMAAALGQMVLNLTVGKKAFEKLDPDSKDIILNTQVELAKLYEILTKLVDEDTAAFNDYMAAMRSKDEKALIEASKCIINVPFKIAQNCLKVLQNLSAVAKLSNKNCISDLTVAANMAYSGLKGGIYNVYINKPDKDEYKDMLAQIECMTAEGLSYKGDIECLTTI